MKDLPNSYSKPLTADQKARIMAMLDKNSNVVFVDFKRN